jgi:hypothetical protein
MLESQREKPEDRLEYEMEPLRLQLRLRERERDPRRLLVLRLLRLLRRRSRRAVLSASGESLMRFFFFVLDCRCS